MSILEKNLETILVVDDAQSNLKILVELLGDEYDIIVAQNGIEAIDIIKKEEKIDLILLDIMMPKLNGYDTCKKIKEIDRYREIPIIFLTAKSDEESIEKAYEAGGIDYIRKPFLHKELMLRIKTQLQLKALIKKLDFYSSYDSMTGIYNRRLYFKKAKELLANSKNMIFISMIDIDDFKKINDTYGHDSGDIVIKTVTKTIKESFDENIIFGRLGGEEFSLIYEDKDFDKAKERFEKLRLAIENLNIKSTKDKNIKTTISIGLVYRENIDENIDTLLKKADESLYESKNNGKNKTSYRV